MTVLQIWHNNYGRPIPLWGNETNEGASGISPFDPDDANTVKEWVRTVQRYGAAIVTNGHRPAAHHVVGEGVGHDDADWCESRFHVGSHAAYLENSNPFGGRRIAALDERSHPERATSDEPPMFCTEYVNGDPAGCARCGWTADLHD